MSDQFRVIQCPVAELQARLNELADDFAPFVFSFSVDVPSTSVSVILVRPPQVTAIAPGALIQRAGRTH